MLVLGGQRGPVALQPRRASPGISDSCLRGWMTKADIEDGRCDGPTKDDRAELVELRRKLRVAGMENEHA